MRCFTMGISTLLRLLLLLQFFAFPTIQTYLNCLIKHTLIALNTCDVQNFFFVVWFVILDFFLESEYTVDFGMDNLTIAFSNATCSNP